ncbi:putative RNA-directed DNA polymerase, eukaryota, reverse transcriptase zinc-binding domain protein [Tanacetum coccineum]
MDIKRWTTNRVEDHNRTRDNINKNLLEWDKKAEEGLISLNQSAFINGRQILDGCLIANEIIRMARMEDHKLLLFKVDFEKAFDSVNWNFLISIMRQMGFGEKWRNWIASSEALQVITVDACNKGIFKGVFLGDNRANISLLQFADDALFFGEWSSLNASNLIRILKCFEMSSSLKVNLEKSRLFGVGIPTSDIESVVASLGCAFINVNHFFHLSWAFRGEKMRNIDGWNVIIDRFREHLSSWKAKSLSIGGRLTLIKSSGGLGVGCLLLKNLGLLDGGFNSSSNSLGLNGTWIDILKAIKSIEAIDPNFKSFFVRKVSSIYGVDWRLAPRGRATDDLTSLISHMGNISLSPSSCDKWVWTYDPSRLFKVRSMSKVIHNLSLNSIGLGVHHSWNSWIPRKGNSHRLCELPALWLEDEDVNHILISCSRVLPVWRKVWSWWSLDPLEMEESSCIRAARYV